MSLLSRELRGLSYFIKGARFMEYIRKLRVK